VGCSGCQRSRSTATDAEIERALKTYADIAQAGYDDATLGAHKLVRAIDGLLAEPSAATLNAAREAWLSARTSYVQTEVYRFYDGPIDAVELLVNTWPIDEAYVEAQAEGSPPGIIEDLTRYPELTRELIVSLNAKEGETSIATGYHVIEFLLWGRDLRRDGPGARPYTDYVSAPTDPHAAALAERRGRYLKLAAELLADELGNVANAWRNQPGTYRSAFLSKPPLEALALVLKGMGSLSGAELAGERLTVAYETKNQENEHSCFSDSTHLDLAGDVLGIQNVCAGRYRGTNGTELVGFGTCELIGRYDAALGKTLTSQIATSLAAVRAIPPPFDTAILGTDDAPGRRAIARSIAALQAQTRTLGQAAAAMQLMTPAREPRR
jgi:putative iron-regulated protein